MSVSIDVVDLQQLSYGADVNLETCRHGSPLHVVVRKKTSAEVVKLLFAATGALVNFDHHYYARLLLEPV